VKEKLSGLAQVAFVAFFFYLFYRLVLKGVFFTNHSVYRGLLEFIGASAFVFLAYYLIYLLLDFIISPTTNLSLDSRLSKSLKKKRR
jgi:hypothetical protein